MSEQKKINPKKWALRSKQGDASVDRDIEQLSADTGLLPIVARILYTRGYRSKQEVQAFLCQESAHFHDPFLLKDMDAAVDRIFQAIERREKIVICGDYDVDGVTSVSLLYLYLSEYGAEVDYYIPSRILEGYGVSKTAIDRQKEKGASLMITVDTGITANHEVLYAKENGIDTVVTDHHECHGDLPLACAVVNPHRPDDTYPFKELAGVGVVFKLICAMELVGCRKKGIPEIDGIRRVCNCYADLVAIGTIADVMPVVDENRLIVTLGMHRIEKTKRLGLRALIDAASGGRDGVKKKRKINSGFIGFGIAPRMNAAGRVSSASIAVELLLTTEPDRALQLADELCALNVRRQVEENRIAEQAYKSIEKNFDTEHDRVIVLEDDTWQQGIIGIVSSRVTEKYGLPSILISFNGAVQGEPLGTDLGKGSGRSIRGLNLVEALNDSEDLLVRYGGHELAAGLTIQRSNIDAFRKKINRYAAEHLDTDMLCVCLDADCEVSMRDLTMELAVQLERLEPFGISNPVPNFVLSDVCIERILPMSGGKHTKLLLEKDGIGINAVWFGANTASLPFEAADRVDVLFQLNINEFQNTTSLQMIVQDIRLSASYIAEYDAQKKRYEEICGGADFCEEEQILPSRDDMATVYTVLRREYRNGRTAFTTRCMLGLSRVNGCESMTYAKLKFILRIMQEMKICGVSEPLPDSYLLEFYFHSTKINIEKSSILRKLKAQMRKSGES